jgi:large subunit ribosomal protein L9
MKVVFIEDVPGTAKIGDIKEVKAGFARNYLLPRRLAMPASPSLIKSAELRAKREERLQDARDNEARALGAKLEGVTYKITARAGSTGKLFGSVGSVDVAERVSETLGTEFDRHNVVLEPIKELGDFQATVRLTRNVTVAVGVTVVGEDGTTAADIKAKTEGAKAESTAEPSAGETAELVPPEDAEEEETSEEAGE